MLRKGNEVKWNSKDRDSLDQIKKALNEEPALIIPNYCKEFLIFSSTYFNTLVLVLP
jgi:hypothetical protein